MNPGQLLNKSYLEIREALDGSKVTSVYLTHECLRRAHALQNELNTCISFNDEEALAEAKSADHRLQSGERGGVLGIPILVKDLILTKGLKTTAASQMLSQFIPPYDSTVVARLRASGAPILAKANLDEFAMGSSNENSFFGPSLNPWDLSRVPGGSSGGSAAGVAARIAPIALGTDTGGSIRQPCSFCGITGIKPTYGRVSRYGVVAFASSLDQVGPMTIDAYSSAAVLEAISGHDIHDATSSKLPRTHFLEETRQFVKNNQIKGIRMGLPKEYFSLAGLDSEVSEIVRTSISYFEREGAKVVEIDLPHLKFSLPVYYLICTAEASSNLARYDGIHYGYRSKDFSGGSLDELYSMSRGEGFGEEVRLRILLGTYALSSGYFDAYYKKASQVRALIKNDFEEAFKKCDVIVGPTSPTTAFKLKEKTGDPLSMYLADVYTLSTNLAGLPGISLNVGFDSKKLPVGMQIVGPWWKETTLLGMSALFQEKNSGIQKVSPVAERMGQELGQKLERR